MIPIIANAAIFARAAHAAVGQRRKYTGEPYFSHVQNVANLVASCASADDDMVAAAYLHDVVEDTQVTLDEIEALFGWNVRAMVRDLTNVDASMGNRKARFQMNKERLAQASARVQTIKAADIIDNISSIVEHDPGFAKLYLAEKREILKEALLQADPGLMKRAMDVLKFAEWTLGQRLSSMPGAA